jgi:hypothetical protein
MRLDLDLDFPHGFSPRGKKFLGCEDFLGRKIFFLRAQQKRRHLCRPSCFWLSALVSD